MQTTKLSVALRGVPETLLWPLYNRAAESRRPDALLHDAEAVRIADAIDYPYEKHFGPPHQDHVLRALRFDDQIRRFLVDRPDATIVALGEGLETQFKRVDNGRLQWLAVDLPESIEVRRRFLPDSPRHRNLACSALDFRWMGEVDSSRGVLVTAQGLLMYFEPSSVQRLIGLCAERFPGSWMLFDTIPASYSASTVVGKSKTPDYRLPAMPWGINANQLGQIAAYHPNILDVREFSQGRGRGWVLGFKNPFLGSLRLLGAERVCYVRVRFKPS